MLTKDKKILIVGLGLMGGSYAQALKRQGFTVDAITRSQGSIDYALERGWIDWGSTIVDPVELGTCDLVIFALYPNVLLRWLEDNQQYLKDGALLTDVTGIKGPVVYKVQAMLRPALEFVGAHPMAGREVYGVRNADCSIFQGANYIVTPTESNTPAAVEATEELGRLLGFARISRLSPERHDEMIGFLSQLTHCIAVALMTCRDVEHLSAYTGDSFRDLTRIARINDEMWSELFLLNRDKLLEQIDLFEAQMQILRKAIAQGDSELLRSLMRLSTSKRALFDK
ncbi:MAG: prephenate dehydrogenase [Bacteroidales bacterium]|nr:prephenate dehydrogenase [Bacteroidales bacterium]MBQ1683596.1 prephenate dehydrogenase [Bacteroidales bacterium]